MIFVYSIATGNVWSVMSFAPDLFVPDESQTHKFIYFYGDITTENY